MAPRLSKQSAEEIDAILTSNPDTCLPALAAQFSTTYQSVCERRRKLRERLRTGIDKRKRPGPQPGTKHKNQRNRTGSANRMGENAAAVAEPPNMFEGRDPHITPPNSRPISQTLAQARSHLHRLLPITAHTLLTSPRPDTPPAVLVDIRPFHQRQTEGEIPGALIIERNVLEWRFDLKSDARLDVANRWDLRVVVFCSEGYTSSLAARSLQELGLENATDIVGGYKAWAAEGLGGIGI